MQQIVAEDFGASMLSIVCTALLISVIAVLPSGPKNDLTDEQQPQHGVHKENPVVMNTADFPVYAK